MNYGKREFDFKRVLSVVPKDVNITIDTNKISKTNLKDYAEDVIYLNNVMLKKISV